MPAVALIVALERHSPSEQVVNAIGRQTTDLSAIEAVMLDASDDGRHYERITRAVENLDQPADVRYVPVPRAVRSEAWNRAIRDTGAPLLLFLGDDFLARPELVQTHLDLHARRPERKVAGIGPGSFPREFRVTPFMRWLEDSGRLYGVSFTRPDPRALAQFFYGGNTSLKRELLESVGVFDERYRHPAFEDWEMGLRLFRAGMEVVYLPQALADHDHHITIPQRVKAMHDMGKSAWLFERDHPGPHEWDAYVQYTVARMGIWVGRRWLRAIRRPSDETRADTYDAILRTAFVAGYQRAGRRAGRAAFRRRARVTSPAPG